MLGLPTARRLRDDGFQVRALARDPAEANRVLGDGFEIVPGDVTDRNSLGEAMTGCDGVHVSVGGAVDQISAENAAALASSLGVRRIVYLSGSTVREENRWFPMIAQKLAAEEALGRCGVPVTILCPTWPMEQLPRFVMGGRASVIGVLPEPWHWFAAEDLARMVSTAFLREEAAGKRLYIHGPEGIPVKEALERYCRAVEPGIGSVSVIPIEAARSMAASTGNQMLGAIAEVMAYFQQAGEPGDPAEANRILGAPTTTLDAWLAARQSQS
jgi:uncharacterized protein YbjT (DUF2867 family)